MYISSKGKWTKMDINLKYIGISFALSIKYIINLHFQDLITPFSLERTQIL